MAELIIHYSLADQTLLKYSLSNQTLKFFPLDTTQVGLSGRSFERRIKYYSVPFFVN